MKRVVIGLGTEHRGDDRAGLEVARRLRRVEAHSGALVSPAMLELWEAADEVILVDAMRSGASPGTVRRFDARRERLPTGSFTSTHALGAAEAVELARALGRLPARLTVYGIECRDTHVGSPISREVETAIVQVVREIEDA